MGGIGEGIGKLADWEKGWGSYQDAVTIDYRPVHDQPLDKEMEHVPPKARVY